MLDVSAIGPESVSCYLDLLGITIFFAAWTNFLAEAGLLCECACFACRPRSAAQGRQLASRGFVTSLFRYPCPAPETVHASRRLYLQLIRADVEPRGSAVTASLLLREMLPRCASVCPVWHADLRSVSIPHCNHVLRHALVVFVALQPRTGGTRCRVQPKHLQQHGSCSRSILAGGICGHRCRCLLIWPQMSQHSRDQIRFTNSDISHSTQ